MVSPGRIRVPPLEKVLQIVENERALAVFPEASVKGVSTAGSRKDLFQRGRGGVLHTVRSVGVDGEGHPDVGVSCIF
jgi:hypothetical protein